MAEAVAAFFKKARSIRNLMKKKLIAYGVHAAIALVLAVLVYDSLLGQLPVNDPLYEVYRKVPLAWNVRCWSDAFFFVGVMWTGVGALMWIATTGFFDLLRYACHSIWMIFNPMKSVVDGKSVPHCVDLRGRRSVIKPVQYTALIVGAVTLLLAFILAMVNLNMIGG